MNAPVARMGCLCTLTIKVWNIRVYVKLYVLKAFTGIKIHWNASNVMTPA
jgi:hypothetical protein